jgi:hypothetical protein
VKRACNECRQQKVTHPSTTLHLQYNGCNVELQE